MKKLNYQFLLLLTFIFIATINAQNFRKYGSKSGTIEYKLSGDASGNTTTTWDNWGMKELQVENTKTSVWGMTNEQHKTTLMLGTDIYTWEKGDNQIQKTKSPVSKILGKENYDEKDIESFSKKSLESLGYKKTGEENFDGKDCEVYEGIGGKLWIWKKNKLALKVDVNLLGIKIISEATKINLDASVSSSVFEIPKGMEIVEIENRNGNYSEADKKDMLSKMKGLGKSDSTKKSDEDFSEELLESAKDAAVEGAKEGTKEVVKDEAKKEAKKTVKSLLKSIF